MAQVSLRLHFDPNHLVNGVLLLVNNCLPTVTCTIQLTYMHIYCINTNHLDRPRTPLQTLEQNNALQSGNIIQQFIHYSCQQ